MIRIDPTADCSDPEAFFIWIRAKKALNPDGEEVALDSVGLTSSKNYFTEAFVAD